MEARAAASLLDEFKNVPVRAERPQTFMEIGGYSHHEHVCSNLLAFFFDPKGSHNLGELFLNALMKSPGIENGEGSFGGNVLVDREVATEEGKLIDILIRSDLRTVLIENKIFAPANNPFDHYAAYQDRLENGDGVSYEDENKFKILLTLYPSRAGEKEGFVNLTHADIVRAVRSAIGDYISEAEPRYLPLLLDFLNTLGHFGEGTRMNHEYIELLGKRRAELEELLRGLDEIRGELKKKIQALGELIDFQRHEHVEQGNWKGSPYPAHVLQYRVNIDKSSFIMIRTIVSPSGWEIEFLSTKLPGRSELERMLKELEIPIKNNWPITYPTCFPYDADLNLIVPELQTLVDKIADKVAAPKG